ALDPAAVHGEVLVDPDVDAAADRLALVARADDDEELLVLGLDRVDQLVPVVRARLPVGEDGCDRAGILGGLELVGQQCGHGVRGSIASITPPGAIPVTSSSPASAIWWWWMVLTFARSRPRARAMREPAVSVTGWRALRICSGDRPSSSVWPARAGGRCRS